jgi:hypothetical protein
MISAHHTTTSRPKIAQGFNLKDYAADSPVHAYSMRRINSDYRGHIIKLRRSSDNDERDFGSGISLGSYVSYSDIDSWLGGATAYIVKWYDQSGNGRDLSRSTASLQPTLSTSAFGRAPYFNVGPHLSSDIVSGGLLSSGPAMSLHIALESNYNSFSSFWSFATSPTVSGNITYARGNRYGTNVRFAWRSDTGCSGTGSALNGKEYYYAHHDGSNIIVDQNETQIDTEPNTSTFSSGAGVLHLGADNGSHKWQGFIYEFIIFDSSQSSANSDAIRGELNTEYSLY